MIRFYLDEMLSPVIAAGLRARGIDAVAALELGYHTTPDATHLAYAAAEGRCVVTKNGRDFMILTSQMLAGGEPHAGVIAVPYTIDNQDFGVLIRALEHFAQSYPDGLDPYAVVWLAPAPADR